MTVSRKNRPDVIRVSPKDLKEVFEQHEILYLYDSFITDPDTDVSRLFVRSGRTVRFINYDQDGSVWVMDPVDQKPFQVRRVQLVRPVMSGEPRVA